MPRWKLTLDSTTDIINDNAVSIVNTRPENGISHLVFHISDYKSKYYSDLITNNTQVDLAISCELPASYTTTFSGIAFDPKPIMAGHREMLEVECWGWGIALAKTLCDTSFGTESENPTTDTPEEILDYIIANEVCKRFGPAGAATQWSLDTTDIDAPHADFSVTNLTSNYQTNLTLVSRLCDLINAHAVADSDIGVHWYVDPSKHFRMKEIDKNSTDEEWMQYYGWNWTKYNFKESKNIIARNFQVLGGRDYYNSIILASALRKPAFDIWTEDNGPTWGEYECAAAYVADPHIVGSHSLQVTPDNDIGSALIFLPDSHDAGWDFTFFESQNTAPHINFYIRAEDTDGFDHANSAVILGKDWDGVVDASGNADFFYLYIKPFLPSPVADTWYHLSIPFGNYAGPELASTNAEWQVTGAPSWSDIDFLAINLVDLEHTEDYFVDDLHFSGRMVQHCYDASEITATKKERMLLIRLDTALDDTLIEASRTGTAAFLAEAELYKRTATPVVGTLEFDLKEDMLPGQKIKVWAGRKPDGTYRWSDQAMRIRKLTHIIQGNEVWKTTAEVTSDVTNCNTRGAAENWDILMEHAGALGHGEAKDLKASGIDPLIPRLAWDPT